MKSSSVFDSNSYQDFLKNLSHTSYLYTEEEWQVEDVRNIVLRLEFSLKQKGIQAMMFNADFNGIQKVEDGALIISPECLCRFIFGQNDLQHNFTVDGLIEQTSMLRGGIKTDSEEKKNNCSLMKAINSDCRSTKFELIKNDRLGFKADNDGENYLCDEQLYREAEFKVLLNVFIMSFWKNITGMDFAQKNGLKCISASEEEVKKFIEEGTFTSNGMLDIDKIVKMIQEKIKRLKHFSHRGVVADFEVTDFCAKVEA